MDTTEIPPAVNLDNQQKPPIAGNDYQQQKDECLKAIAKINSQRNSASVVFYSMPSAKLLEELNSKGYQVKYTLDYDSKKEQSKYMCKLKIINPAFQDPGSTFLDNLEENFKKFGFDKSNLETEESVRKLLNSFMNL